jgi:hypothetical protein
MFAAAVGAILGQVYYGECRERRRLQPPEA